ncbi:MAG TPA: adenylate/guanylate cyclase domain-containing protein [Gaiellaceae bacterium]|nr:adenylate/guanylate cyclase domain-containing protein [Gaiellaceae bacterium]
MPACPNCGEENPERARFCWSCGAAIAEAARTAAEERKIVSVLFVDLVGFTAASEKADPEDVRARLRPYHARVKQEIERFGGTVEKFVGDAVMAVFGAPVSREDDAERAVNSALRILDAIVELNEEHPDLELTVRGAVNTGEAMVTLGARPAEGESFVAGDVVNTAARLQQSAPVSGIVVGETTYRATKDLFEYEPLEPVAAKGKAESLPLWHAIAPRRRFGVDVEPIVRTPLIGRDDDLALLQSIYTRTLRDASVQLVTVAGEPGVGKTRLLAEFRKWVDDRPELVFWRQGRSLSYGAGITYWALGEMVKAQAGILESDTPEEAAAKLAIAVEEAAADTSERDWLNASLAPLVGASAAPAGERDESFTAWRRFIEGIASERPLVLVFEDLHWADDALVAFVEHLVDWSTDVPLLVLCSARPELYERHAGWGGGKRNSNTISLSPLGADETARLLAALLQKAVLPAETQRTLLERAGGNPLYAEEFVRMLSDRGVLTEQGELSDDDIPVPDNVQALIAARLDTLPPDRKALLHDGAVVGKVFWAGAIASMGDRDEDFVRAGLHELARKELVRSARTSSVSEQAEYSFWHLLVRDVAYSQIPRAERGRKHVAAAEWVESMAGERVTDHAELLAYHYEQALELAKAAGDATETSRLQEPAFRFLGLAGDRARSLDLQKAADYYTRALDFAPNDLQRARALLKLAEVAAVGDTRTTSRDARQEAYELFLQHGDELGAGEALVGLSWNAWLSGASAEAERMLAEATELLERHPPGRELSLAYRRRAGQDMIRGRAAAALVSSQKSLDLAEELGIREDFTSVLQFRGVARCELGDVEQGLADLREGLRLSLEEGFVRGAGIGYSNLGSFVWLTVGAEAALEIHEAGIAFDEQRGSQGNRHWKIAESAWMLYDLGRWDEVLERTARVLAFVGSSMGQLRLVALPYMAQVLVRRGKTAEAATLVEEFVPLARAARDGQVLVPALAVAALVEQARGDLAAAVGFVEEIEEATQGISDFYRARFLDELATVCVEAGDLDVVRRLVDSIRMTAGRAGHSLVGARAVLAEADGDPEAALPLFEEAAKRWAEYGYVFGRGLALLGSARCLLALGRGTEATPVLHQARDIFAGLDAAPMLAEVDALLGDQPAAARAAK